ncbi:MAG: type I methionyl aminopeptidase [Candidatus Pacebacteria bacterium]|nr:type I methionyl aminopeptidase [Candidatus Paceibacterota bacterium]
MIKLKTKEEIQGLKEGGQILAQILKTLSGDVKPGIKTNDLELKARELLQEAGAESTFLGYRPSGSRLNYPAALCVSVNDEIVHGIPSERILEEGDVVTLDLGLKYKGLFTDMAVTVPVGKVSDEVKRLIAGTEEGLAAGIAAARVNGRVGDIGAAVEAVARKYNFGLVTDLAGHGVGFAVHEEPYVPNYGEAGKGEKLVPGLVIAIEPMFTLGTGKTKLLKDGFTFITTDKSLAAHAEKTIAITEEGVEILTKL